MGALQSKCVRCQTSGVQSRMYAMVVDSPVHPTAERTDTVPEQLPAPFCCVACLSEYERSIVCQQCMRLSADGATVSFTTSESTYNGAKREHRLFDHQWCHACFQNASVHAQYAKRRACGHYERVDSPYAKTALVCDDCLGEYCNSCITERYCNCFLRRHQQPHQYQYCNRCIMAHPIVYTSCCGKVQCRHMEAMSNCAGCKKLICWHCYDRAHECWDVGRGTHVRYCAGCHPSLHLTCARCRRPDREWCRGSSTQQHYCVRCGDGPLCFTCRNTLLSSRGQPICGRCLLKNNIAQPCLQVVCDTWCTDGIFKPFQTPPPSPPSPKEDTFDEVVTADGDEGENVVENVMVTRHCIRCRRTNDNPSSFYKCPVRDCTIVDNSVLVCDPCQHFSTDAVGRQIMHPHAAFWCCKQWHCSSHTAGFCRLCNQWQCLTCVAAHACQVSLRQALYVHFSIWPLVDLIIHYWDVKELHLFIPPSLPVTQPEVLVDDNDNEIVTSSVTPEVKRDELTSVFSFESVRKECWLCKSIQHVSRQSAMDTRCSVQPPCRARLNWDDRDLPATFACCRHQKPSLHPLRMYWCCMKWYCYVHSSGFCLLCGLWRCTRCIHACVRDPLVLHVSEVFSTILGASSVDVLPVLLSYIDNSPFAASMLVFSTHHKEVDAINRACVDNDYDGEY